VISALLNKNLSVAEFSMEVQDYIVVAAAFLLAAGTGFAAHQVFQSGGEEKFASDVSLRVDAESQIDSVDFDNHTVELRYEDTDRAQFYYSFDDARGVQQIEGLQHDGTLQNFRDIKSFGNQTYFLYLRYMDDPNQSEDGYMELYRIEET
jgi:hypothetical protein